MNIDPDDLRQIGAAAAGSGIAAWLAQAKGFALFVAFTAGFLTAWIIGPTIAELANLQGHQSAVGFAVGFLAIMILRKVREVIESFPATAIGKAVVDWCRKFIGLPPADVQERSQDQ